METEELIKLVDGIYKNILDKFNPGARQMINAGKAYLKALHGAAAASRLYVDAINKLARQAQQGTWGGCSDVGTALMKIVEVYKEIQDQQMNILKAFYVDLLVPLETNLEKDTKVVQSEQKRFLQQHKQRAETYSKAAAMMKKQRKKSRSSTKTGLAMDKELKNMQVLEEEKTKLDAFCEQSLKNAITQERRRYGFVLERQCSLAKHYLSYHTHGVSAYHENLEKWSEVAKTREFLPESVENIFSNRLRQISVWQDEDLYSNPRSPHFDEDRISIASQLRKTKSMDASCLDIRSIGDVGSPVTTLSRAKSEYNLNSSTHSLEQDETPTRRPKSMAVPPVPPPTWDTQLARSLYAYLSSGENQLSFLEGDLIALIGERNKGWQFGENLRTQASGWFPLAYTEILDDNNMSPSHASSSNSANHASPSTGAGKDAPGNGLDQPTRMFGDTLHLHRSSANAKQIRRAIGSNNIPPPALPAPVPTPSLPYHKTGMTTSQSTQFPKTPTESTFPGSQYAQTGIKTSASSFNFTTPASGAYSTHPQPSRSDRPTAGAPLPLHLQTKKIGGPVGNVSLHSSNDSGFSNDPPPQPEIDYSDDDSIPGQTKLPARKHKREVSSDDNNNTRKSQKNMAPIRQSSSSGNLIEKRYYISDGEDALRYMTAERRGLVKRTKSFWRFGKNNSDNEILEGMSLWKHRDLVDVDDDQIEQDQKYLEKAENRKSNVEQNQSTRRSRKVSRDASNDSERTLLNTNEGHVQGQNQNHVRNQGYETDEKRGGELRNRPSFRSTQNGDTGGRMSLPVSPQRETREYKEVREVREVRGARESREMGDDQFYDDGDDGLLLRTVNRKNILQQYTNDSTGPDSENESEMTSDDPYDCIVVDDQAQKVRKGDFPNVAALGRKLEKLSKNTKYSPNKEIPKQANQTMVNEKNNNNIRHERHERKQEDAILNYRSERNDRNDRSDRNDRNDRDRSTFKTFGHETTPKQVKNNENGEKESHHDVQREYGGRKRATDTQPKDKRRFYAENSRDQRDDRKTRQSYDSIDSEVDHRENQQLQSQQQQHNQQKRNPVRRTHTDVDKKKYYRDATATTTADEDYSDATIGPDRQFLPRTKLSKTNSGGNTKNNNNSKYGAGDVTTDAGSLTDYGESLQRRIKNDYGKMDEKSQHNGNMYGPWYDLWGMDASVRK